MNIYRLKPYRTPLIVLSLLTITLWILVFLALAWLLSTDLAEGGSVPVSYVRQGRAQAFGITVILTPLILLVISPVCAVALIAQADVLKKRRES